MLQADAAQEANALTNSRKATPNYEKANKRDNQSACYPMRVLLAPARGGDGDGFF